MGKLTKKAILKGTVAALALSAGVVTTANAAVTREAGADRYATSTKVLNSWPTTPTTAILAAGVGHDVDALTVAPLAKQKNAPIILVDTMAATSTIVDQFAQFDTVYIASGSGVISTDIETELKAAGKTVIRLGGQTRYDTALNIAKALGPAKNIVVANGDDEHLVDSLSIASIAAAKGMPIFLSSVNSLDSAEASYAEGLAATNVYVLGGSTLVSDASVEGLGAVTRLAGAGRYETNAKIVNNFKSDADVDLSNVYIASGEDGNLIDSLVAAPLAGLKKAPIVFAHNSINEDVNTLLSGIIHANTNITVVGGTGAVSDSAFNEIKDIQTPAEVKTALTDAITAANTNKTTATVSADGIDILPANQWVTTSVMTAYTDAIAAAQLVADNATATQAEVDAAATTLATATTTFNAAKAAGIKEATSPSAIVLAAGSMNSVSIATNVVIPAAGATDTTGALTGWANGTADTIKFNVTDAGGATSTITINGVEYTSGDDYTIAAASDLTITVTTTEAGLVTGVRTFTITVTP